MPDYTLTKHRGKLALTYTPKGWDKQRRISTGTDDQTQAEFVASQIWAKLNALESERLIDLWPSYVRDRGNDGVDTYRYRTQWKRLEPYFGHRIGSTITREDCRAYYKARKETGSADSSIRTEVAFLNACLKWKYGHAAPKLWLPPNSPPRDTWLTKDQVRTIIDSTDTPHIKLFITLALSTGARASSILDLEWSRIDFETGTINYKPAGRITTNKRRIELPMNKNARQALTEAYSARLTDYVVEFNGAKIKSVRKAIERLSKNTGIKFSQHVFRHTCAVWMAQDDVPMQKIAQFLGHTTTAVTERVYARYSPSFMRDASQSASW